MARATSVAVMGATAGGAAAAARPVVSPWTLSDTVPLSSVTIGGSGGRMTVPHGEPLPLSSTPAARMAVMPASAAVSAVAMAAVAAS